MTVHEPIEPAYAGRIREIGTALYGATWQTEMSRALRAHHPEGLDIGSVTVRKWAAGTRRPPPWAWFGLMRILAERIDLQKTVLEKLISEPAWLQAG
jgi:hypothetical protein